MKNELTAKSTITVGAPANQVWGNLTSPETVQIVMLGMRPISDWKVGSALRWMGRHGEKPEDNAKGMIEIMEPAKRFQFTFYYPGYGYPDAPENYNTVVFNLSGSGNETTVEVEQGDFSVFKEGETFRNHSQAFWEAALSKLKELSEK